MAAGLLVAARHPAAIVAGVVYLAWFYPAIIREEALFLRTKFAGAGSYDEWANEVPLFFPRLTPGGPRGTRFEMERFRANREWRTVLGLLAIGGFLVWRAA
jgi:hypothetical protein